MKNYRNPHDSIAFDQFPIRDSIGMMAAPEDLDDRVAALLSKIDKVQNRTQDQDTDSFSLKSATQKPYVQQKSILQNQLSRTQMGNQNMEKFDSGEKFQKLQLDFSVMKKELEEAKFQLETTKYSLNEANQINNDQEDLNQQLQYSIDEELYKIDQLNEELNVHKQEKQEVLNLLQQLKQENSQLKDTITFQNEQMQALECAPNQVEKVDTKELEQIIRQRLQSEFRLQEMEYKSNIMDLQNQILELKNKIEEEEIRKQEEEEQKQNQEEANKYKAYLDQQEQLKQKQLELQLEQERIKQEKQAKLVQKQKLEAQQLQIQQEQYEKELAEEEEYKNSQQLSLSLQDDDNFDFNATAQHIPQVSQLTSYLPDETQSLMSAHNSPLTNISMHQRGDSILEDQNSEISKPLNMVKPPSKFAKPVQQQKVQQNQEDLSFTDRSFTVTMDNKTPPSLQKQRQSDFLSSQLNRARSGPKTPTNHQNIPIPPSLYIPSQNFNNSSQIKQILANFLLQGEANYLKRISAIDDLTGVQGHLVIILKDLERKSYHSVCKIDLNGDLIKISGPDGMPGVLKAELVDKFLKFNTGNKKFEIIQGSKCMSQGVSGVTLSVRKSAKK